MDKAPYFTFGMAVQANPSSLVVPGRWWHIFMNKIVFVIGVNGDQRCGGSKIGTMESCIMPRHGLRNREIAVRFVFQPVGSAIYFPRTTAILHSWRLGGFVWKYIARIGFGDYAEFPNQTPGSLVIWGTEWPKCNWVIQGNTFYEQWHQIPSHRMKNTIFPHKVWRPSMNYMPHNSSDPNVCGFLYIAC